MTFLRTLLSSPSANFLFVSPCFSNCGWFQKIRLETPVEIENTLLPIIVINLRLRFLSQNTNLPDLLHKHLPSRPPSWSRWSRSPKETSSSLPQWAGQNGSCTNVGILSRTEGVLCIPDRLNYSCIPAQHSDLIDTVRRPQSVDSVRTWSRRECRNCTRRYFIYRETSL